MHIHFADTSSNRGQYDLLAQEKIRNGLLSYYYRSVEKDFACWWWDEILKIHLAHAGGDKRPDGRQIKTLIPELGHDSTLASYAYKERMAEFEESWELQNKMYSQSEIDLRPRVLIDSGAFTAFTTGKTIKPLDYGKWALGFKQRWESKMSFLRFMNLDIIGDQEASWGNQKILEKMSLNPVPIITFGADIKHLNRAIDNYDFFALGGLVPYVSQKKKLQNWLDKCFCVITSQFKKTGVMPKVHLLGITSEWVLTRYPCYSSDSSSWVACLRFGRGQAAGIKKIPRHTDSSAARQAVMHTLRCEIEKYRKMEIDATNLWKRRGVVFD